ncbi:Uncharacterised protein [Vibrio cholerae]|nr:Uncharacterised protein [Vibrio cholerae]
MRVVFFINLYGLKSLGLRLACERRVKNGAS